MAIVDNAANVPSAVAPTNPNQADIAGSQEAPPAAPDQSQNAPAPNQSQTQPPPPGPAVAAAPAPPPPPGHNMKIMSEAFMGSVLGALAGKPNPGYHVDNETGKMIRNPDVPQTSGDKLREIARNALTGLAAGAQVPPQLSAAASWGAGIGAGAGAVTDQQKQQDLLKRQQANQDFERNQQAIMRRAENAHLNMLTYNDYLDSVRKENDLNPDRTRSIEDWTAAGKAGWQTEDLTESQLHSRIQADQGFFVDHRILPGGVMIDPSGAKDSNGMPAKTGRVLVISGTHNGNMPLTPGFKKEAEKLGALGGASGPVTDLPDELDPHQYAQLSTAIINGRMKEREGWEKAVPFKGENGKWMLRNAVTDETKPFAGTGAQPNIKDEVAQSVADVQEKVAKTALDRAEVVEKMSKADLDKANAESIRTMGNMGIKTPPNFMPNPNGFQMSSSDLKQDLTNKGVTLPSDFETLWDIGHYRTSLKILSTTAGRKGMPNRTQDQAATAIKQLGINPNYFESNYNAVNKMRNDYMPGGSMQKAGGQLVAFSTASAHWGRVIEAAQALQNGNAPAFNAVRTFYNIQAGQPQSKIFDAIVEAATNESERVFKGSAADVEAVKRLHETLSVNNSPAQTIGPVVTYATALKDKAMSLVEPYQQITGEVPAAGLTIESKHAYDLMGIDYHGLESKAPMGAYQGQSTGSGSGYTQTPASSANPTSAAAGGATTNAAGQVLAKAADGTPLKVENNKWVPAIPPPPGKQWDDTKTAWVPVQVNK